MNTMEKLKDFIRTLKSNSLEFVKQQDLLPCISGTENEVWKFSPLEYKHLHKIWVSRWLGIFLAGNLINTIRESPGYEFLESSSFFIKNSTFLINQKILRSVNLNDIFLDSTNLSKADLSRADLFRAYLTYANLSYANLSNADLFGANLSQSLFINIQAFNVKLDEHTNFYNLLTDMPKFTEYIKSDKPKLVRSKQELNEELKSRGHGDYDPMRHV